VIIGCVCTQAALADGTVLTAGDAERMVEGLRTYPVRDVGSSG
jgi:hypothetical protein